MKTQLIEISPKTILIALAIVVGFWLAWEIRIVFIVLFAAFILNAAIRPAVDFFEKYKIPRFISTVVVYFLFFGVIIFLMVTLINQSLEQLTGLIKQLPNIVSNAVSNLLATFPSLANYFNPSIIRSSLLDIVSNFLNLGTGIFTTGVSGALGIINLALSTTIIVTLTIIISVYMLIRQENVYHGFLLLFDHPTRKKYDNLLKKIEATLGNWLRAQLLLMLVVGFIVYIGLMIPAMFIPDYTLHHYALPIAFVVSLLEILPGTGLLVGGFLATLIAAGTGPGWVIIYVIIFFGGLQQVETVYVVPNLMNKVVGVDPILTIVSLFVGFILFQYIGLILAVPFVAVLQMVIDFGINTPDEKVKT